MYLVTIVVIAAVLSSSNGARILGVLPMPSRSHSILLERLMRELATRGHQITYVAATLPSSPIPNMEVVHVPGLRDAAMRVFAAITKSNNTLVRRGGNPWMSIIFGHKMSEAICDHMLSSSSVQELLTSDKKFDLILGEIMMDESVLAGFSYFYEAPIVAFATTMPMYSANHLVGNIAPASYIPDLFLGYNNNLSLWERIHSVIFGLATEINYHLRLLPRQHVIMKKYFGDGSPYIGEILRNTSLVLVNHHHSLGFPRPYAQNMIEIAGVHLNEPQPLPENLKLLMDNAKAGVILFSLGSNANSSDLPEVKISAILDAFSKVPQQVLWKFESDLQETPANVHVCDWLPQTDILAHPNLKLFITHGGLLSITEAMSFAVPVVGIPLGGDQHYNMRQVQDAGWGKLLSFDDISSNNLLKAITDVINSTKFKEAAIVKSKILLDNPMSSLATATWWIEYVLRNGGNCLRSSVQDIKWYEFYLLDVLAFITAFAVIFILICCVMLKIVFRFIKLTMLF